MDFTVVTPGFEFIPPPEDGKYLEFLELCTRTCYKSEDKICEGSAEKLMRKVVHEYEHLSVVEHLGMLVRIDLLTSISANEVLVEMLELQPLFRFTAAGNTLFISGNIRMWLEFFEQIYTWSPLAVALAEKFNHKYPFFAAVYPPDKKTVDGLVTLLDENPLTNRDNMSVFDMKKHMTLTSKLIGDRSMSHQLVRHRKQMSYSQESQRYCSYGKKGGQYIIPPTIQALSEDLRFAWEEHVKCSFKLYEGLMREGKLPPEDARSLLPNCTKTEVVTTATLDMWEHIFIHRGRNKKAQWQIREIFQAIEAKYKELLPNVF